MSKQSLKSLNWQFSFSYTAVKEAEHYRPGFELVSPYSFLTSGIITP